MIIAFFIALFISTLTIPVVIKVAELKNLVDQPDDKRKVHKRAIPFLGGVSVFLGLFIGFNIANGYEDYTMNSSLISYLLGAITIIFFIGLKDDIVGLSPFKKLITQLICAFIIIVMADVRIPSMYGIFGIYELPLIVSYTLSVFAYIVIVNSVNLIDGIDGLAGGIGLIASVFFGLWFYAFGELALALMCAALAGSLIGFLIFNFSPAKIFMGDGGSLTVGTILAFLALSMLNTRAIVPHFDFLNGVSRPVGAMAFLCHPLLDTLRVFTLRARKGISPFTADKQHIHHFLLANGANHAKATFSIYVFSVLVGVLAIVTGPMLPTYSFAVTVSFALILSQLLTKIKFK